ncbi:F0F1 ATP synthase subunit gamma [Buchnera aphidicola (Thelaxes californica)]|uniref:ATP synthase gamma chain n=1 Tax=Buchnera aphidicola (Thelaxes californica) TaxID=1315998 RepID=A0A4D6YNE7_9GAMM|nr:F0F1 ATP synthase subunit gamma [Buchnera aphidicola]QCI26565.1 F0F1 ATP synthase subunit gamma [Buchnera aphidicola (Thelaxes californica)]
MTIVKEIKNKIASVKNTQKITKAMEMVSISKMRKTQNKMNIGKPYSETIKTVIQHVTEGYLEYQHPYLKCRKKIKKIGCIIISTDKGLCGSLNTNLFKKILEKIKFYAQNKIFTEIIIIGSKGIHFFESLGYHILDKITGIENNPSFSKIVTFSTSLISAYKEKRIDKLYIGYNHFHNRLNQYPIVQQLLPIITVNKKQKKQKMWDYLYEPNSKFLLNILLNKHLEFQIYQSILEQLACEQAARMIAMNTANNNSSSLIQDLQLRYNKSRQSSITQEITEIIAGVSSIS